jgi:hypothetical protein
MHSCCDNQTSPLVPSLCIPCSRLFCCSQILHLERPSQLSQPVDRHHACACNKHIVNYLITKIVNTIVIPTSCKSRLTMKESTSCTNCLGTIRPYNELLELCKQLFCCDPEHLQCSTSNTVFETFAINRRSQPSELDTSSPPGTFQWRPIAPP